MSYRILSIRRGGSRGFELIWSDGVDPDNNRYVGRFRTRYEAEFEKDQLEKGADVDELKKRLAARDKYVHRPRRTRYQRLVRGEEII